MISVYTDADYLSAHRQKRRVFYAFMLVTCVYLAFCIAGVLYQSSLPYADPKQTLPRVLVYVATGAYIAWVFPFMAIKYSRVRKYCRMLYYVSEGLKMEEKNYFYRFREKSLQKDNIDVVGCVFETWNNKKQEWLERETYFDPEKPLPDFENGDLVRYITQSNFIVQYEIVQKQALEFEDEYEEYDERGKDGEEKDENGEGETKE